MNEFSNIIQRALASLDETPGPPFEIIPKGRGEADVAVYKFFRWYNRRHKKELSAAVIQKLKRYYLYGKER